MIISATDVKLDDDSMWVSLSDGRVLGSPLAWFPRLLSASSTQRNQFELSVSGIHWDELDEAISVAGLIAGHRDQTRAPIGAE